MNQILYKVVKSPLWQLLNSAAVVGIFVVTIQTCNQVEKTNNQLTAIGVAVTTANNLSLENKNEVQVVNQEITKVTKEIVDLNALKRSFYEARKIISSEELIERNNFIVFEHSEDQASIYALLPDNAIPQTLTVQSSLDVQPRRLFYATGNLVVGSWGVSLEKLKKSGIEFVYVPDPLDISPKFSKLSKKVDRVWADSQPLEIPQLQYEKYKDEWAQESKNPIIPDFRKFLKRKLVSP